MNNAKDIAETVINSLVPEAPIYILARAYLELEKKLQDSIEHQEHFADLIKECKNIEVPNLESEITKLKEENEKQREINLDLWNEIEQLKTVTINDLTGSLSKANIKNDKLSEKLESTNAEKEKLKKSREVLRKAVEFYSNEQQWNCTPEKLTTYNAIGKDDLGVGDFHLTEDVDDDRVGGKKAREALKADDEIMGGVK